VDPVWMRHEAGPAARPQARHRHCTVLIPVSWCVVAGGGAGGGRALMFGWNSYTMVRLNLEIL
jgi:hypothetical protein